MAAVENKWLTALHVVKLNLSLDIDVPSVRWGHVLTCLLKKEFGNIYIDKICAICLFMDFS